MRWERQRNYLLGRWGAPELKAGVAPEIRTLAGHAIKNVISVVVDSFGQNLSVADYRDPAADKSAPAWSLWDEQRMAARQSEIHRGALTYGVSYVVVLRDKDGGPVRFRPRSPRHLIAVYEDPQIDEWPMYALETWVQNRDGKRYRRGLLLDDQNCYPVDMGQVLDPRDNSAPLAAPNIRVDGPPMRHGADVCPVVRYVARRDSEGVPVGEVEPLIDLQRTINAVNLDRLIVSRWGAFPQKVISGWAPASKEEGLRQTASDVWTFTNPDVKAQTFAAANVAAYNEVLTEMQEHVAMVAQISPAAVTGKMVNLSAEALAAGEANQQRKLVAMRESLGESHRQLLELAGSMSSKQKAKNAEVFWRDTEARAIGAVTDAVTKLVTAAGTSDVLPELLPLIPGVSAGMAARIREVLADDDADDDSRDDPGQRVGQLLPEASDEPAGQQSEPDTRQQSAARPRPSAVQPADVHAGAVERDRR